MKTTIILSTLLLPTILFGQAINHFEHLDSKWNVAKTYPAANQQHPNFVATTTTVFGFQGDTIINSEQWFKLYSTNDSLFQHDLVYRGLTRTEDNKVFYIDTLHQLDTLYDFNLNTGDSIAFNLYGTYSEWIPVTHIDSVQIDGVFYKRIKFAEPSISGFDLLDEEWIEGIGSKHDPLFPAFPVKFSTEISDSMLLICSFSDNQQVWQHPSYQSCYVHNVLNIDQLELSDFKVYPNPFTDIIHIENIGLQASKLAILNSLGQTVQQVQINHANQTLDLSELKAGIYFLRIDNSANARVVKIIKKQ